MPKSEGVPSVVVSGDAPASVLCELRRMGRGWIAVEHVVPLQHVPPETLAVLRYWRDDTPPVDDLPTGFVPVLDLVCSRSSALELTHRRSVERFDVADPLQRLALLARLATLREQRTANSEQRTANSEQRTAEVPSCGIHQSHSIGVLTSRHCRGVGDTA